MDWHLAARAKRLFRPWLRRRRRPEASPSLRPRQEWSIGIYSGATPLDLVPARRAANPVLSRWDVTDVPALFVADPFMIWIRNAWHMFLEVYNARTRKGEIGLATSSNGWRWKYRRIVLAEDYHLSYPYVFEWNGDCYLVPESHQSGQVRLYRAQRFPYEWSLAGILLDAGCFADSTLVHYSGRWWLLAETNPDYKFDTLRLFFSEKLTGPWQEHPQSPVVTGDPRSARPAGRPVVWNGRLIRFAQDCYPQYGSRVRAFEIAELTPDRYREVPLGPEPFLAGSGAGWNKSGMHHVDAHPYPGGGWIACVDGRQDIVPKAAEAVPIDAASGELRG